MSYGAFFMVDEAGKSQVTNQLRRMITPRRFMPVITMIVLLVFWEILVTLAIYPRFIIPSPMDVFTRWQQVIADGTLLIHVWVTAREMLIGLALGVSIGLVLGYLVAHSALLEDLLSPIIVAFQATPTLAYAPLLIIWFGTGMTSKIIITSIVVFFPTLMNVITGIRHVPQSLRDLMLSLNASRWQTLIKLEIPAAMPVLLTGLKTSATLAVIGAVVGEFVGASEGLGFLVVSARSRFDTSLVLVAVFTMTLLALLLYSCVSLLEHVLLKWQRNQPQSLNR
jgi:NitT/TauT family transport system permease protein